MKISISLKFKLFLKPIYKSGIGYDIHQIDTKSKQGLKLCGVRINYNKLIGHSDADVGIHAICDSIFGALSMKDIGYYFSNNNPKWKNKNSIYFLKFAKKQLKEKKFNIVNLDINFICEKPNISKYRKQMIKKISSVFPESKGTKLGNRLVGSFGGFRLLQDVSKLFNNEGGFQLKQSLKDSIRDMDYLTNKRNQKRAVVGANK